MEGIPMEGVSATGKMNGASRQADRPRTRDPHHLNATGAPALGLGPSSHPTPIASANATVTDAHTPSNSSGRRNVFSLPSLRGTDSPSWSPYAAHHHSNSHHYVHQHAHTQAQPANLSPIASNSASAASQSITQAAGVVSLSPRERDRTIDRSADRVTRPINSTKSSNSQDTNASSLLTNEPESDPNSNIFTPPASTNASSSDGGLNGALGNDKSIGSSQESQLLQLSHLAAAQEKMPADVDMAMSPVGGPSRKRMADGMVKQTRDTSSASPVHPYAPYAGGHSRNTSTVSIASTAESRIGELSSELKARLSYAMVKVNHGWQSHNIDQVESLASQAGSPNSTTSTLHGRHGSMSASPRMPTAPRHRSHNSHPPTGIGPGSGAGPTQSPRQHQDAAATSPPAHQNLLRPTPSLAPPVSIEPSRPSTNARRNSNPSYTPAFLSHSGYHASPRTPVDTLSAHGTPRQDLARTPVVDPILFSPHQNVREQDAIESLLFMSSPGNSANLKHAFPTSSSQPVISTRTGMVASGDGGAQSHHQHRTALPTAQPRKSLPTGRQTHHSQPTKKVGFEKSPSNLSGMEVDEQHGGSLYVSASRGAARRKVVNGHGVEGHRGHGHGHGHSHSRSQSRADRVHTHHRQRVSLSVPLGLSLTSERRAALADEDIDRMLDRCEADDNSSESDGEIQIPVRRPEAGSVRI